MYVPGFEVSTSPLCFTLFVKSPSSLSTALHFFGSNVSPTRSVIVNGTVNSGAWFSAVFRFLSPFL